MQHRLSDALDTLTSELTRNSSQYPVSPNVYCCMVPTGVTQHRLLDVLQALALELTHRPVSGSGSGQAQSSDCDTLVCCVAR